MKRVELSSGTALIASLLLRPARDRASREAHALCRAPLLSGNMRTARVTDPGR
jgi:hypothetical protein